MTKGGLFSYLRAYLPHITPYKLFIRLFFVEKQKLVVHPHKNVQRVFLFILGVLTRPQHQVEYKSLFKNMYPCLLLRRPETSATIVPDAFGMRSGWRLKILIFVSTNIRQTVRKCYKMKSDSRVLLNGFLCFVCRRKPFLSSILPLLPCQCTPFALQLYPFCIPIVPHLKRKSIVNGVQLYSFCCKIESF